MNPTHIFRATRALNPLADAREALGGGSPSRNGAGGGETVRDHGFPQAVVGSPLLLTREVTR